jgi:putative addiction module component (TIGR02574 family)
LTAAVQGIVRSVAGGIHVSTERRGACDFLEDAMSDTKPAVPAEFDATSTEERIAFVQELWDRIARDQSSVPVPDSHKQILDRRLNAYRPNPHAGRPWNEVREELLSKLRDS